MFGQVPHRFGTVSMVTSALGPNDPKVGDRTLDGDEEYLFVYNTGNSQISPGHAATVSAVTGYSVTVSTTTSVDFVVGVCKHATLTTATYGWLVTKGFTPVQMDANNSAAAGQALAIAADGKFALKSNSTGYPCPTLGKTIDAIASGASGYAFITTL